MSSSHPALDDTLQPCERCPSPRPPAQSDTSPSASAIGSTSTLPSTAEQADVALVQHVGLQQSPARLAEQPNSEQAQPALEKQQQHGADLGTSVDEGQLSLVGDQGEGRPQAFGAVELLAGSARVKSEPVEDVGEAMSVDEPVNTSPRAASSAQATSEPSPKPTLRPSSFPTPTSTYRSKHAFFTGCRDHLQDLYGLNVWKLNDDSQYARAGCGARERLQCRWAVVARLKEGQWVVDGDRCNFAHTHPVKEVVAGDDTDENSDSEAEEEDGRKSSTSSKAMRQLAREQDTVFVRQRKFAIDDLQAESQKVAQEHIAGFQATQQHAAPSGNTLRIYEHFCAEHRIPSFPITPQVVALCVHKLSTVKQIDFYPFVMFLDSIRKATASVWKEQLGDEEGTTLARFEPLKQLSRKESSASNPPPTRPPAAASPTKPQPSVMGRGVLKSPIGDRRPSTSTPVKILGAPMVGDLFRDLEAALEYYWTTCVPVLGVHVSKGSTSRPNTAALACNRRVGVEKCRYRLVFEDVEEGLRLDEASTLEHNHGPMPQILADPRWRPRRMIRVSKGDSDDDSSTTASDAFDDDEEEDRRRPSAFNSSSASKRAAPRDSDGNTPSKRKQPHTSAQIVRLPNIDTRSDSSSAPPPRPPPRPSPFSSTSHLTQANPRPSIPSSVSSKFLRSLVHFLHSLSPTLAPFAEVLYRAGITDMSLLVELVGRGDECVDAVTKGLLPPIPRAMLRGKLRGVREAAAVAAVAAGGMQS